MTVNQLFGSDNSPAKPRTIRLKKIRAVYEKLSVIHHIAA